MRLDVRALSQSIGDSDILGIGKDKKNNLYITQGHFIIKVDRELLVDNIRIARTIEDDFNIDDVEQFIDSISKDTLLLWDSREVREVVLSMVFQHIKDYSSHYEKVVVVEHNIGENMTLLENKASGRQIVINCQYFNMIKDCSDILSAGQFSPVLIMHNDDTIGYIFPMKVANKKNYFKLGRNN